MASSTADSSPEWLPPLEPFGGDWPAYEQKLYEIFLADFVTSQTTFRGKRVSVRFQPSLNGKGYTFSHLTSEGEGDERLPDLRRCERIRWLKAILEAPADAVRTWEQFGRAEKRIAVATPDFGYVVFLEPHPERAHLLTAYVVTGQKRVTYRKAWEANKR